MIHYYTKNKRAFSLLTAFSFNSNGFSVARNARNLQVARNVLNINQHRVLSHAQVITVHQELHKHPVERLDVRMEFVDDNLQLCNVHVGEHLTRESSLGGRRRLADFVEGRVHELCDWRHALLLALNLGTSGNAIKFD